MGDNMKKGIDVSQYQGDIDWKKVKNDGVEFAILRAGFGQNNIDKKFYRNIYECSKVGMPIGIYWFSYALNEEMARQEANYAVQAVQGYNLNYQIFFDFEYDSVDYCERNGITVTKDFATNLVLAFCNEVKRLGYTPGNYANKDYVDNMFNMDQLSDIDLWYAYYSDNLDRKCSIWQYSSSGYVDGISSYVVDLDYAFDKDDIEESLRGCTESESIKDIQRRLNSLINASLVVDGIKGKKTTEAIKKFQYLMGLSQDGIVGDKTLGAMHEIEKRPVDGWRFPHYEFATRWIQWRTGSKIDGVFAEETQNAVKKFQRHCNDKYNAGLTIDGIVGKCTWECMFKY